MTCHPDTLIMGMSSETFWGGVAAQYAAASHALAGREYHVQRYALAAGSLMKGGTACSIS
jgi:hypothetical protein